MGLKQLVVACYMVIHIQVWWCDACNRDERLALLQFQSFLNVSGYVTINPNGSPWQKSSNCCYWRGIKCDPYTGSITHLDLAASMMRNDGYLNISLFHSFKELRFLDLSGNQLLGFLQNEGTKMKFSNLKTLKLTGNHFSSNVLSSLEGLSSLRNLYLDYNRLSGSFNITKLTAMKNLEVLDLSGNMNITKFVITEDPKDHDTNATGVFPYFKTFKLQLSNLTGTTFYREFYRFTNVKELHLDSSVVDANFFLSLQALSSLKSLSFGFDWFYLEGLDSRRGVSNIYTSVIFETVAKIHSLEFLNLQGFGHAESKLLSAILLQGLCNLKHLQYLDLSENNLNGKVPQCLANMTSLEYLDLSFNSFVGTLSSSPLNQLTSIKDLRLGGNHFQIPISLVPFYNYSKLQNLIIEGNELYANTESHNLTPKFQLESLSLPCYGCGGVFPRFLYYQYKLKEVDLSHNKMRGEFPYWLIDNNTKLFSLHLSNNSLSGSIKMFHSHSELTTLDISNNFFSGQIPTEFGSYFPKLSYLYMHNNNLTGSIPSSFGNLKSLWNLDLTNNKLSGRLPENLTIGCTELSSLKLSNNSLQGQIFSKNMNLKKLMEVQLGGNQFTGTIPDSLHNCSSLTLLDLSSNRISGEIPSWLGSMQFLRIMDLSMNNITGNLRSFSGASYLTEVYLSKNMLRGSFIHAFSNCSELKILDLSHNILSDNLSIFHGNFSKLSFLLLSRNNLEGEIPVEVCKLNQLSLIDLSNNSLTGHIPHCLRSSSFSYRRQHDGTSDDYGFPGGGTFNDTVNRPIEFTTKSISYSYKGEILTLFSGIDLSCNQLKGEIPLELGNLDNIKVLNLSHNSLRGPIPSTFSNLKDIESLDLSYNNLEGHVPPQLTQLHFLSSFSVAHNNLSGKTPDMIKQFATFDNTSYEGNPFLCGKPLPKSCKDTVPLTKFPGTSTDSEDDGGFMDMGVFYVSFVASYAIVLLGIFTVLYINPYWRRVCFYFMEEKMLDCYYFIVNTCPRLLSCLAF